MIGCRGLRTRAVGIFLALANCHGAPHARLAARPQRRCKLLDYCRRNPGTMEIGLGPSWPLQSRPRNSYQDPQLLPQAATPTKMPVGGPVAFLAQLLDNRVNILAFP